MTLARTALARGLLIGAALIALLALAAWQVHDRVLVWALDRAVHASAGRLQIEGVSGSLTEGLRVRSLAWQPPAGTRARLNDVRLRWRWPQLLLGRVVIFATDADSFHGHPDPLACPADRARRSIATYYYAPPRERGAERTTRFQVRPDSGDRPDREVAFDHFVQDWVPRPLRRFARRLNPFRG